MRNIRRRDWTASRSIRYSFISSLFPFNLSKKYLTLSKRTFYLKDGTTVGAISRVVTHPTLPYSITGHEDHHIRFFDNRTGKQTHSMVAHLDAVTSLAIDGHGLYLISGSHDCSVRLWNLETKACVQARLILF